MVGAFVIGRSTKIIISSIGGCFISSVILSIFAPYHKMAPYMGVVIMGFAIAF
jgi:hypothetical protein